MLVINNYNSLLNFDEPKFALSIGPGEIREVDDDVGKILLRNKWIKKVREVKVKRKSFKKLNNKRSKLNLSKE